MKLKLPDAAVGRIFQVWEYRVSHKQLLLRCPKSSDSSKNFDVMFYNVQYMDLPSVLRDLEIEQPNQSDIAFAESRIGEAVSGGNVFVLKSGNQRYIVVAGGAAVSENSMGLFESPFKLPTIINSGK
jgi:hypothetical protein